MHRYNRTPNVETPPHPLLLLLLLLLITAVSMSTTSVPGLQVHAMRGLDWRAYA